MRVRPDLFIFCLAAVTSVARAADPPEAERRADAAALGFMHRTGFLQIAANRQGLSEVALDEPTRKKVDDTFVRMESNLRPLIALVQTDPDSLEAVSRRGREIVAKSQEDVRQLLSETEYEALAQRTRLVQAQLMAVTAGPPAFRDAKTALQATEDQAKKLDALLAETSGKVRKLTDALTNEERMIPSAEQLVTVAIDARKRLRAILTEEQLKQLDESTNTALVDHASESPGRLKARGH